MIIKLSKAELKKAQEIRDSYQQDREKLGDAFRNTDNEEERRNIARQQQAVMDSMQAELDALLDRAQRKRFKKIEEGGIQAIIDNAKEQAPALLEDIHRITKEQYKDIKPETMQEVGVGTVKDGAFLLQANYAAQALREELYLHIEALQDNREALTDLLEVIRKEAEDSDFTDNEKVTDAKQKHLEKVRFRRDPLADIKTFGLMNDKANAMLLQDKGIFSQEPNGQLMFHFNQAPRNKEQVPVYVALNYTGIEGLSKKLNAYDFAVYNAISDIYYYCKQDAPDGKVRMTLQEIWRRMNGKQGRDRTAKAKDAQLQRIKKSIDKMRHIDFTMDISAELKANYITIDDFSGDDRLVNGYYKDTLLVCGEGSVTSQKGLQMNVYIFHTEPILYSYNRIKKHLLFVPFALLDTSDKISDGENVAEFKLYLLGQIKLIKERERHSNRILLNTIYTATGIQAPEERFTSRNYENETTRQAAIRRGKKADRAKIEGILESWTEPKLDGKSWIKGFTPINKDGKPAKGTQPVVGYDIIL